MSCDIGEAPVIFSDLLRSDQMLKRDWDAKSNGKLPHLLGHSISNGNTVVNPRSYGDNYNLVVHY